MAQVITSLAQASEQSLKAKGSREINASFNIEVEGKTWNVYTVAISYCDILCYCEQGTATFLVDRYGVGTVNERHTTELHDWNEEK